MTTRQCNECKRVLDLNNDNFQARKRERRDGWVIVFEYDCRTCAKKLQRRRNKINQPPTGGAHGLKRDIRHTGPKPGSIEWKFFCT